MTRIDPTNLFGFLIQDIARLLSRAFEQQASELNISRPQARLLAYVALSEGAKQTEIAALMDIQKITLTKLVDGLETMKLIERRPDPSDRRVRRLYMAAGAHSVLDNIWQLLSEVSNAALAPLSSERKLALIEDLATIRDHAIDSNAPNK